MIDRDKMLAIELLIDNKLNKTEIAKQCNRSRQWLYDNVLNDEICRAEVDKRLQQIQTHGINVIKSNLQKSIDNIIDLANNSDSEKIKADCNFYLIDRVLGKTTTKLDISTEDMKQAVNPKELDDDLNQFKLIE